MISYEGKVVLAPMVRVGTLPMRLLCLEYGADLVWSPETVDKKLVGSIRTFNPRLGTFDYIKNGDTLVFRTHPSEKDRLVLQLGSADPELALQAALTVAEDVSGVDLNCGCPKHFSVHAGMGAALLKEPEKLVSILKRLVIGIPHLPITAKIRVLPDQQLTIDLVKRLSETGIRALTVHCRTPAERPKNPAHYELLPEIVKLCPFPVIANGDIFCRDDFPRMRAMGVSSLMIARAAQWNPSVFRGEGFLEEKFVTKEYIKKCLAVDNPFNNTKYTVLQMWIDRPYSDKLFTRQLQQCKNYEDLLTLFDIKFDENQINNNDPTIEEQVLYNAEDDD